MAQILAFSLGDPTFLTCQWVAVTQRSYGPVRALTRKTSFPSGHVASSVGFWGWLLALGMLLLRKAHHRWQKGLLSLPLVCRCFCRNALDQSGQSRQSSRYLCPG